MTIFKDTVQGDLLTVMKLLRRDIFQKMMCCNIGEIISFDASTQTASVQLLIKRVQSENPDGTQELTNLPVLPECPVINLFGGNAKITLPVKAGDQCLVFFADRQIDNWYVTGQSAAPDIDRYHDISDGIVLVGLNALPNVISDYLENGIRLENLASKVDILENSIESVTEQLNHTGNATINGDVIINGTLTVSGVTTINNNLSAVNITSIGGGGSISLSDGNLTVDGAATLGNATIADINFVDHVHPSPAGGDTGVPK